MGGIKRLLCISPLANNGLYIEEYIYVAPLVCAYCMIAFKLLAKDVGNPLNSNYTFISALTTWPHVSVKVLHGNQADTLTTGIWVHHGSDLNSWIRLFAIMWEESKDSSVLVRRKRMDEQTDETETETKVHELAGGGSVINGASQYIHIYIFTKSALWAELV